MIKLPLKSLFICLMALPLYLTAVQVTKECYKANESAPDFEEAKDGHESTIIRTSGWHQDSEVLITESDLCLKMKEIKKTKIKDLEDGCMNLHVSALGYAPGAPITFTFKDSTNKLSEEITIIPHRLYVTSTEDGATVEAKILQAKPSMYSIELDGFKENETIQVCSFSYNEQLENDMKVNRKLPFIFMPGVIGKIGGICRIMFTRASGEILRLELPWGLEWMKYNQFYDENKQLKSIVDTEKYRKAHPKEAKYFDSKR